MGLGDQIKQQLAAKALQRQLERAGANAEKAAAALQEAAAKGQAGNEDLERFCRFDTLPGYQQFEIIRQGGRRLGVESPFFRVHEGAAGATTRIGGRDYINYASYNYLNMSGEAEVSAAAKAAIDTYGTSASASRMVAGERPVQRELEHALAGLYDVDDAVAFVSGHATNVSTISAICGPNDLIVHDSLAHNSIVLGAQLSGARRLSFPHNDLDALDEMLGRVRRQYQRVLVVVEGIYSMDGDYPDLPRLVEIKKRHAATLMVDEAHSLGVLGETGRGLREHFGMPGAAVDIWMGTLSKTLASCGGYIAGPQPLIDFLRHLAPGFLYSVGLSPALAAAALRALQLMLEHPERVTALRERGHEFLARAREAGLNPGTSAGYSVVPVITGSSLKAAQWANAMFEEGINVQPIFYPAVEERAARLRFFICSSHTSAQFDATFALLRRLAR